MRALVILLLSATPSFAALSGYYDSAEKIGAILGSSEVADALHQAPVRAVENIGSSKSHHDLWVVRTRDCDLKVELIPRKPSGGMVGKTTYKVKLAGSCN